MAAPDIGLYFPPRSCRQSLNPPRLFVQAVRRSFAFAVVATFASALALPIVASITATAQGLPDLTADGWLDHEPQIEGYPYVLSLAIWNVGDAAAGNFTVLMQYSGYGGPELLQIPESDPLMPGEKRIVRTANLTGSQGTIGFGIMMDYYGVIAESNEANNQVNRVWDGISPYERPILRATVQGNETGYESLAAESTLIYNASLHRDDVLRFRATGQNATQPFDVFLFIGETNLNTYFGFGTLSPEILNRSVTTAQGEFRAREDGFVYLVVDNLSDGPYPPWPRLLNVTVTIEIEPAPAPTNTLPDLGLSSPLLLIAVLGAGMAGGAIALAYYLGRRSRAQRVSTPMQPPPPVPCPSCGTSVTVPSAFCGHCGATLSPSAARPK